MEYKLMQVVGLPADQDMVDFHISLLYKKKSGPSLGTISLGRMVHTFYSTHLDSITLVTARIFVLQSYLPNSRQNFPVTCHEMSKNCW